MPFQISLLSDPGHSVYCWSNTNNGVNPADMNQIYIPHAHNRIPFLLATVVAKKLIAVAE